VQFSYSCSVETNDTKRKNSSFFQIRNALTVLTKILPHFPVIANLAGVIEKRIEKVNFFRKKIKMGFKLISSFSAMEK
jgi:THO complex subunit 2